MTTRKTKSTVTGALITLPAVILLIEQFFTATKFDWNEMANSGTVAGSLGAIAAFVHRAMTRPSVHEFVIRWALGYREKYGEKESI